MTIIGIIGAAEAGDFVVVAAPLKLINDMPVEQLAGKIVLDTNNYMPWRDGHFPMIDLGEKTIHELRQEHLPTSKVGRHSPISKPPAFSVRANRLAPPTAMRCRSRATFLKPSSS